MAAMSRRGALREGHAGSQIGPAVPATGVRHTTGGSLAGGTLHPKAQVSRDHSVRLRARGGRRISAGPVLADGPDMLASCADVRAVTGMQSSFSRFPSGLAQMTSTLRD